MKYIPTIITRYRSGEVEACHVTEQGVLVKIPPMKFTESVMYSHNTAMQKLLEKLVQTGVYCTKPIVKEYAQTNFTGFTYYLELH